MKKFFAKGLVALLPLLVTFGFVYLIISFINSYVGEPAGSVLKWATPKVLGQTEEELIKAPFWKWFYSIGAPIIGFCVGVVLTFILGVIVATLFGKRIYSFFEKLLVQIPVFREIYPYAKQFTGFLVSSEDKKVEFKSVVMVPFPAPGLYSIGFITGEGLKILNDATKKRCMCIFVPTSPTPFTGFVVYVPQEDLIPLPISVEDAMRIIISCGILSPAHQRVDTVAVQEIKPEGQ